MGEIIKENIDRFSGFSDIYNSNRPTPPKILTKIILMYADGIPETVADIGSGTGLSTFIWKDIAGKVIGIEPNDDMRKIAEKNNKVNNISFRSGFSNNTGLPAEADDIVTISQAFHWMDITSTLDEVYRILKPGGVFAVYDCDWPPCVDWALENEYNTLREKCDRISYAKEKPAVKNDKNTYIEKFNEYGKFRFIKEAVCYSTEPCTPERMIGIALSQGGIQDAMKTDNTVANDINRFCDAVKARCKDNFEIVFSYRLRLAVK